MAVRQLGPAPSLTDDLTTKTYVDNGLGAKANLASPTFTGTVRLPTTTDGIVRTSNANGTVGVIALPGTTTTYLRGDGTFATVDAGSGGNGYALVESGTYPNLYTVNQVIAPGSQTISPASQTAAGIVELATLQEALDGVDDTRAVTPAGLAYAKPIPGGLNNTLQYNLNGTTFAGASDLRVKDGHLLLVNSPSEPAAADAGTLNVHAASVGGRSMLRYGDEFGYDSAVQPFFGRNRIRIASALSGATTFSTWGLNMTATGTATAATPAATNAYTASPKVEFLVGTASTTAVAGFYQTVAELFRGGGPADFGGFHVVIRWGHATGVTNTNHVFFAGLSSSTAAPTSVQPSTLLNTIGVGYDSTTANYSFLQNGSSGTGTYTSTGIAVPTADRTTVCELVLYAPPNNTTNVYALFKNLTTGVEATATLTGAKLPSTTTMLAPRVFQAAGGTSSAIGVAGMSVYVETDN